MAQVLGWVLAQGTLPSCIPCFIAKAKQKKICKTGMEEKAEKPVECIFSDQSMIRAPKGCSIAITNKNWHAIEYKKSRFYETK